MDYEYLSHVFGAADHRGAVPAWAIGALDAVAGGRRPLRAVAHPLGFTCLPLERVGGDGVCVHLWSPRTPAALPTTSVIHAHSWQLASYVLFGELRNEQLRVSNAADVTDADVTAGAGTGTGTGTVYRVHEVRSRGDVDELRPTPRLVRCVPEQSRRAVAGDVYSVPAGVFHATEVEPGAEVATVALGRAVVGLLDRSLGPVAAAVHQVRRQRCGAEETALMARLIIDRLLSPAVTN
jgi:hypothetical protein